MNEQVELNSISKDTCFVGATNVGKGRRAAVVPGKTAARYLHYGRITIDAGDAPISFDNHDHETGLICLNGDAEVVTGGETYQLGQYDSVYVPRDSTIEVRAGANGCDVAEVSAPVSNKYPARFVSYADVRANPKLHIIAGKPPAERDLNVLIGANVDAGRIMAGLHFQLRATGLHGRRMSTRACWRKPICLSTCPEPAFGVQFVYTDPARPELVQVVREGDCVLMPQGYHPNVAAPGTQINFLWMMAAIREGEDRQYGVVNVQPEFAAGGSGLEAAAGK